ncbi:hypothetical protein [Ketobacter sp.]|uniref:hypothetical protein n=1 Tax=Ketobacter sp. TaxID=2083498 RepID=UPI0025BCBB77|nr:hypothetical protein [Ketobacter sp.]
MTYLIRFTLMLFGIWGAGALLSTAQAANCHEAKTGHQTQVGQVVHDVHAEQVDAVPSPPLRHQAVRAEQDCCAPGACHCPAATCGAGHGVPLAAPLTFALFGATERIHFTHQVYSLLPPSLPKKPPMAA